MEDSVKEQQQPAAIVLNVPGKSKLRYPLRSATKVKDEKTPVPESSTSSVSKRGRGVSSVSKSTGVLDFSGKEKSSSAAKPPRRMSIPAKSASKPLGVGTITPISEARSKRSTTAAANNVSQGKSETPLSDVSRTSTRKKFNAIASASYWLSQIKLSETAAKHSISLGFFKLALEAGCEPLQRMRDELKSYVRRYDDLGELVESVKELYESYNIVDNQEQQVQISETCSQVPEEGTRSSDDEVHSSSSTMGTRKLRPRSLNADAPQVVESSSKKEVLQKNASATRTRSTTQTKNSANSRSVSDSTGRKLQKKPQRPNKQEATKDKEKVKKQGQKPAIEEVCSPVAAVTPEEEDKENMDAPPMEEISLIEVS